MVAKLLFCAVFILHGCNAMNLPFPRLSRLGKPSKVSARQRVLNSHKRMPLYMIKLYKELTTGEDGGLVKKNMPYKANAIRGINPEITKISQASMKIHFKMGYFRDRDMVQRDEIHLFMNEREPLDKDIFKPFFLEVRDVHTRGLIREFKVPAFNQGWQVLSLKQWTNKWIKNPDANEGLFMTIYRGRSRKLAFKNPFIDYPNGNGPYLILFATESVRSLLAWRFLIENALNSVADTRPAQGRRGRRETGGQPQCIAARTEVKLENKRLNNHTVILAPSSYETTTCSETCTSQRVEKIGGQTLSFHAGLKEYCCKPSVRRDFAILTLDPITKLINLEILPRFVATTCMWSKQ